MQSFENLSVILYLRRYKSLLFFYYYIFFIRQ